MKAKIEFKDGKVTACLLDGTCLSHDTPIGLAQLLLQAGVSPDDTAWDVWTLENKFRDIMRATASNNESWAKMAQCELYIRKGNI
jgi:hypothetical protein